MNFLCKDSHFLLLPVPGHDFFFISILGNLRGNLDSTCNNHRAHIALRWSLLHCMLMLFNWKKKPFNTVVFVSFKHYFNKTYAVCKICPENVSSHIVLPKNHNGGFQKLADMKDVVANAWRKTTTNVLQLLYE